MESYGGHGRQFLMRIILAHLYGQTPEGFAEQELTIIKDRNGPLKLCEHGWPTGYCPDCTKGD